jgi:hypothetical protein
MAMDAGNLPPFGGWFFGRFPYNIKKCPFYPPYPPFFNNNRITRGLIKKLSGIIGCRSYMPISSKKREECAKILEPVIQYMIDTELIHPFASEEEFNILYPEDKHIKIYNTYVAEGNLDVKYIYLHSHIYKSNNPRNLPFLSEWTFEVTVKFSESEYCQIKGWLTAKQSAEHNIPLKNGVRLQILSYIPKVKYIDIPGGTACLKKIDGEWGLTFPQWVTSARGYRSKKWLPIEA